MILKLEDILLSGGFGDSKTGFTVSPACVRLFVLTIEKTGEDPFSGF